MNGGFARLGTWALVIAALGGVAAVLLTMFVGRDGGRPEPVAAPMSSKPAPVVPSPATPGPIEVPAEYAPLIVKAVEEHCPAVDPRVLAAQLFVESDFRPDVVSPAGAKGIAQFMPNTWKAYGIDGNQDGKKRAKDPQDAIPSAAIYNCRLMTYVRDVPGDDRTELMLAAYNAGPGSVREYGGVPPFPETEQYLEKIANVLPRIVFP